MLSVQWGRSNVGLGRVEDAWTRCLLWGRCVRSISQMGGMYSMSFVDLEKAYNTVDRHGMWHMLGVCGVGGRLLKAVQSFYVDSRACVRVGNHVSEWFPVNVIL